VDRVAWRERDGAISVLAPSANLVRRHPWTSR